MKIGRDYRISTADRAEALARLANAWGLGKLATARRFEELAVGLPDALRQTVESLTAIDQARPIVADYVVEQTQRAKRCEKIAATAARRAAPLRSGSPAVAATGSRQKSQTTTCQHPCPTKGGKPCGKPIGASGRCGVPAHDRYR